MREAKRRGGIVLGLVIAGVLGAQPSESGSMKDALRRLTDADPSQREEAIADLANGARLSGASLHTMLLQAKDPLVSAGLAEAWRRVGLVDDEVKGLARDLVAADAVTRRTLVWLARATKPSLVAPALRGVVADEREAADVREAAATALGRVGGTERAFLASIAEDGVRGEVVRAAVVHGLALAAADGADAVATLATAAGTPELVRDAAWAALADPDVDAAADLADLVASASATVRAAAIAALAARHATTDAVVDALKARLTSTEIPVVAVAAVEALATLGKADATRDELVGLLDVADATVQAAAIRALGFAARDTRAATLGKLRSLLASANFRVRCEAALALAEAKDGTGYAAMLADSVGGDAFERPTAQAALATIRAKGATGTK